MRNERYWVIGGEYESTAFERLMDGTEKVLGPYLNLDEAKRAWERIAVDTRAICNARFTIVREGSTA